MARFVGATYQVARKQRNKFKICRDFLPDVNLSCPQRAAGAKKSEKQALGPSPGGFSSKIHVTTDGLGNKIKVFRRVFSRFEKLDRPYLGFLHLVGTLIWLRWNVNRT